MKANNQPESNDFNDKVVGSQSPKKSLPQMDYLSANDDSSYHLQAFNSELHYKQDSNAASNDCNYGEPLERSSISSDYKKSSDLAVYYMNREGQSDKFDTKMTGGTTPANPELTNKGQATQTALVSERIFMNSLLKHTGIALAIIIPLAAFSVYAATPPIPVTNKAAATATNIDPKTIIHKSASMPMTVDSVDLERYAGTWYEIGRLPMYFQRDCARDVTATYTIQTDGKGIVVTNKCTAEDGSSIVAEGLAKPADSTGSKLKVTFLPSWIRWLPVGRADYWVLARDTDYKTALVGTPDKEYLWLLARSPNVTQQTYAKYRQIAQQQGYNLKEFNLTPQTNQTVNLIP